MQKLLIKLSVLTIIFLVVAGCSGNSTKQKLETPELQMIAEGPLYSGANSAMATWEFDLRELLGNQVKEVSDAKITAVEVTLKGAENLPELEKMVLEVTSKNTPMTRIGLYEGAISAGKSFTMNIAEEQENIASAFVDGKMTFVGDFDSKDEEYLGNLEFTLKVKFELGTN
jgi:hypothetical protein